MVIRRIAALSSLLFLAACGQQKQMHPGRGLFISYNCQSCHKIGNMGSATGPDLSYVGFRRSREWLDVWMTDPKAWKPDTKMPDPKLSPKNRKIIVDYLATLKGQDFHNNPPWNKAKDPVSKGKLIYSKAGCVACHGRQGIGGHPNNNVPGGEIPALVKTVPTYTPEELKEKIRKGVPPEKKDPSGPDPLVAMPAWGEVLSEKELDAIVQYLYTIGKAAPGDEW